MLVWFLDRWLIIDYFLVICIGWCRGSMMLLVWMYMLCVIVVSVVVVIVGFGYWLLKVWKWCLGIYIVLKLFLLVKCVLFISS